VGVPPARLDALAGWLKERGARGVALARMTPGLRVGAIAASGLAALRYPVFLRGLAVGNAVFVGGHFLLGYAIGAPALRLLGDAGGLIPAVAVALLVAAVGAAGWRRLGRRARIGQARTTAAGPATAPTSSPIGSPVTPGSPVPAGSAAAAWPVPMASAAAGSPALPEPIGGSGGDDYGDWADAACPACLALALWGRSRAT
jgi:hypothetical protein